MLLKEKSKFGWITPDGKFFGCNRQDNNLVLNWVLGFRNEDEAFKAGYIQLIRDKKQNDDDPDYLGIYLSKEQEKYLKEHDDPKPLILKDSINRNVDNIENIEYTIPESDNVIPDNLDEIGTIIEEEIKEEHSSTSKTIPSIKKTKNNIINHIKINK